MNELIPTGAGAVQAKTQVANVRADLVRRTQAAQEQVAAAREEMERQRAEMEAIFNAKRAELEAAIAPLKAELAKVEEVSWTIDLYLGRDEEATLICDGEPAPADTPLVVRQMVLAADEESLILADDGGLDWRNMDAFLDWLRESAANRDRIIPDARGVVVVVPSRKIRDYGDHFMNEAARKANQRAYWLVRNGERLTVFITDEDLHVGPRLLPRRDEFIEFFTVSDHRGGRTRLEPGSDAWMKAQDAADARRRHFMRLMLVLQGIVDRSTALRPLPAGGIDLLSVSSQDDGKVILVNEEDLVITDGRPSFWDWQTGLLGRLRPGLRVIVASNHSDFQRYEGRNHWDTGHARVAPNGAEYPPAEPLLVERSKGSMVVRYARTEKRWVNDYEYRAPKNRASCKIEPGDRFVLPFDLATVEELTYYLNSRAARTDYLNMVPIIKTALKAKEAEALAEVAFRDYLQARLAAVNPDADAATITADTDALVHWWKTANTYARPLVGEPESEAKAAKDIEAEYRARLADAAKAGVGKVVVAAARAIPGVLAVGRSRAGKYLAWSVTDEFHGSWLTVREMDKTGTVKKVTDWTIPSARLLATTTILWQDEAWATWMAPVPADHLRGPEHQGVIDAVRSELTARGATPLVVTEQRRGEYGAGVARKFHGFGFPDVMEPAETRNGVGEALTAVTLIWSRDRSGKVVTTVSRREPTWVRYSQGDIWSRRESIPWSDDPRYVKSNYDRKVWADDAGMVRYEGLVEFANARSKVEGEKRHKARAKAAEIRTAVRQAWLADQVATARARFVEDFGDQADDIWEHHLATLKLEGKYREPNVLSDVAARLVNASVAWHGKTVAELLQIDATLHTGTPVGLPEAFTSLTLA